MNPNSKIGCPPGCGFCAWLSRERARRIKTLTTLCFYPPVSFWGFRIAKSMNPELGREGWRVAGEGAHLVKM